MRLEGEGGLGSQRGGCGGGGGGIKYEMPECVCSGV